MALKTADLVMFMGQSNMAGRGVATAEHPEAAPELIPGAGYEYRAVSAPGRLVPIAEPFGRWENRPGGIDDGDMKTGSMVTAFVNEYYSLTGVPVVGVSASKGGSIISQWRPGAAYFEDAVWRLSSAEDFLRKSGVAAEDNRVTVPSRLFETMLDRGLMKDRFHYLQQAYNEVGRDAAENVAGFGWQM